MIGDPDGRPVAYGWVEGNAHWLEVPGAAVFRLEPGTDEIVAIPESGAGDHVVEDAFLNLALPLAFQLSGLEALHASAARLSHGVVAFCALSGTGKTTVACALVVRGNGTWADDAVIFDSGGAETVVSHRIPFLANVRPETREALGVDGADVSEATPGESAPLAAVVLLERHQVAGRSAEVLRLSPADALTALEPHAHRFNLGDFERKRRTMQAYLRLVARVPVLRVRFAPGFERLPALLDNLEQAIGEELREAR